MTEEEKKVFIKIKDRHEYFTRDDIFKNDFEQECLFEIGYLAQIIEKQQKENEELKKNQRYKKDFNGDKIFCLEYDKETLRDMVLEQQEEIKELNNRDTSRLSEIGRLRTKNSHLENEIKYYYIPKDKLREIIEELNKNIEEEFKKCSGRGPTIALHSLTFCRDEFKELLKED